MAEQKQNSKAVEEEEMEEDDKEEVTDLNTICSESTFETENLEVLGSGGHLTPEGESSRLLPSEKSSVELGGSHTVTCTLTVSLAVPALPTGKYLKQRIQVDESGSIPRMQCCYHIEYFLLPDDLIPRKLDLVLFGVVAKLFTESNSEAITPWFENDKMWISWNHSVDIDVTNEYVIKLRDHKIILKIWDTKNKVSSKVRHSKPTIASSLEGDSEGVGKSNANRHVLKHVEIVTAPIDKLLLRLFDIHIRGSGPKRTMDATVAKGCGIASLQLAVMPLLSGEKSVISRLAENNPKVLDAYMTFSVETPLLSERQRHELNPLTIRINSATCLPNTPVPIEVLQRLCVPTYCKYKFHSFPPHRTHGQVHGTHVYFKDVNVLLTGTMKPGELQRCLRGPPLDIEVHDRDRNTKNNTKKPCLFGEDEPDEKVGKVSFPPCKSTICSSSTNNKAWHPHGVAKVSLTELLLGKKYLTISAPIHSCSAPNTATFSEEDKKEKITESVSSSSLLPMGHYLESDSLLKVRVEIAVPLGLHAEIAEVTSCLYGCIIYIFDYNNSPLLHDLVEEISEINAKALQLVCHPVHPITMALAALKLKTTLEKVSELDIVTGFHLLDGATHLFVLEGLKDKAIKRLWDRHFERTYRHEDGQLEILYNSQLSFPERLYTDLEAIFYHFCLCQPLCTITKQPLLYIRGMVPRACFQALSRYDSYLCHSKRLRDVIHGDLLPSAEMISVLSHEYGVPLTDEDLFTRKPPLLSFSSDDCTVPGKVSRVKQAVYSSLDNYNEVYVQRKKEIADKTSFERNHIEVRKMKKPKFEVFRISPIDGKSVFNYSSQRLNSAELAKQHLRQEMAKEPKNRFSYCHEYLSATFDPVDVAAACKELSAKSKSMWLSPDGFVFPGFKSSIESNLHPQMPDEKWQENVLHANMEPVLSRDRWSWDKRHIDFDLYKKPPELFMTAAPQTGNGSVKIN
uniref:Cilia and flagella associated protein 92 (putative) n=1 Tax=Bubo bubo TaxID=30461 RepID=A0A8C0IBG6_BUBBB